MKITQLQKQKRSDERFNVYLDGTYYCALTAETIVKNSIKEGLEIDKEKLDELQFVSEKQTALTKTVKYLGNKLKTKKELIQYLKGKGYVDSIIDYVLSMLSQYGYVNDQYYANTFTKSTTNKNGKKLIALKLKQKGVDDKTISQALESVQNERETVIALAQKYLKNKPKTYETSQKLYRFLMSRGFESEDIMYAIKTLIKESEEYESGNWHYRDR